MLGELRLGLGPEQAGLQHGGAGLGVHGDQPVEPAQVEGDHAGEPLAPRGQAADDRRTAAERDQRDPLLAAPGHQRRDLVVVGGAHDDVRGVGAVACAHPQQVGRGLPAGVPHAGLVVGEHVVVAEQVAQGAEQAVVDGRVREPDVLEGSHRVLLRRTERELDQAAGGLREGSGLGGIAPACPVHRSAHMLQCDI